MPPLYVYTTCKRGHMYACMICTTNFGVLTSCKSCARSTHPPQMWDVSAVRIAFPQTNRMPKKNQRLCWILSKLKTCRLHMVLVWVLEALVHISLAQKENEMTRSMPAHLKHLFPSQMSRQHHFVLTKLERGWFKLLLICQRLYSKNANFLVKRPEVED